MSDLDKYLEFPCEFPFKVMAQAGEQVELDIVAVINRHAPDDYAPSKRESRDGNYVAYTFTIQAQSKEHLETIYRAVSELPTVKMTL